MVHPGVVRMFGRRGVATPPPTEIDMSESTDVAWVKARNDPALWHRATMATLAYLGDRHGFLPWVVQQPNMDRATAGWLLLWLQGSRYLRGAQSDYWARISDGEVVRLLNSLGAGRQLESAAAKADDVVCRVGKANAARECAPDGVPTIQQRHSIQKMVGTAPSAPLPTLRPWRMCCRTVNSIAAS
jgi:hypothetical protein